MKMAVDLKPIGKVCIINPRFDRNGLTDDDAVSFVPMSAVDEQSGEINLREEGLVKDLIKGYTPFSENDVLFAKITPCMENGKVAIARSLKNAKGFGSTEFHVFRPGKEVIAEWIFYCLRNPLFRKRAEANMAGSAGQKRVPVHFFERAIIPIPRLTEQKRAVSLLIRIESALEKRRQTLRLTDEFLKSAFLEMFGDPIANTKKLPLSRVWDFCDTTSGGTPNRVKNEYFNGDIPWVKSGELKDGFVIKTGERLTELGLRSSSAKRIPINSILVAMYGATVGEVGLLKIDRATTNQAVAAIIPKPQIADPLYLFFFFRLISKFLVGKRVGGGQPNISQQILREVRVPLPTLIEQQKFADLVHKVEKLKEKQKQSETQLQNLFNSLMQRAFRGEI